MRIAICITYLAVSLHTTARPIPSIRTAAEAESAIAEAVGIFERHGRCGALAPSLHPTTYQVLDAADIVRRNPAALQAFSGTSGTVNAAVDFRAPSHAVLYLLPAFYRLGRPEQLAILYHELRGHVLGRLTDKALGRRLGITVGDGNTHGITVEILKGCPGIPPPPRRAVR